MNTQRIVQKTFKRSQFRKKNVYRLNLVQSGLCNCSSSNVSRICVYSLDILTDMNVLF